MYSENFTELDSSEIDNLEEVDSPDILANNEIESTDESDAIDSIKNTIIPNYKKYKDLLIEYLVILVHVYFISYVIFYFARLYLGTTKIILIMVFIVPLAIFLVNKRLKFIDPELLKKLFKKIKKLF